LHYKNIQKNITKFENEKVMEIREKELIEASKNEAK
jgi:hypothetical protein